MKKSILNLILIMGLTLVRIDLVFSQTIETFEETEWAWGEVVAVDLEKNQLTINYTDYIANEEKQIVLEVTPETKFENVKSLDELKQTDSVSVDYIKKEGKNIATTISVEEPIPEEEIAPTQE